MPDIALYYPEWSIREPLFLAESLLYWDRLTCLVPFKGERHTPEHEDREVGSKLQEAHRAIRDLGPSFRGAEATRR